MSADGCKTEARSGSEMMDWMQEIQVLSRRVGYCRVRSQVRSQGRGTEIMNGKSFAVQEREIWDLLRK